MGIFALHRRSQHAAASADTSGNVVVFDLFMGFDDEAQARHFILTGDPLSTDRLVGELGAAVSKDKLELAKNGPEMVQPNAVGDRANSQSVASENTTTRIEMLDTGKIEIVSDQNDAKIFTFGGAKLAGRVTFTREGTTKKFNISIERSSATPATPAAGVVDPNAPVTPAAPVEPVEGQKGTIEDEKLDQERTEIDDFISPEFDEIIRVTIEDKLTPEDISLRMSAIRKRLAEKKLTKRDIVFVLRFLSGGADSARRMEDEEDIVIALWNDASWSGENVLCLDSEGGNGYKIIKSADGTYEIPRYQFINLGIHNGEDFNKERIHAIVENTNMLAEQKYLEAPVKIGHHKEQTLRGDKGELALGWVAKAWEEGNSDGYIHIKGMPRTLAYLVSKGALKNRSAEIFRNVEYKGKKIGPALKAISLLGTSTPAVLGMQGAATLDSAVEMYADSSNDFFVVNIRSERPMAGETISLSKEELDKMLAKHASDVEQKVANNLKLAYEKDNAELKGQVTVLSQNLKIEQDQRRRESVKSNRESNVMQFETLVRDGNILPAQKDEYIALCNILDGVTEMGRGRDLGDMLDGVKGNKDTMEFSITVAETDKKVDVSGTPKALLLRLLKGQKQINLGLESKDLTAEAKAKLLIDEKKKIEDMGNNGKKVDELAQKIKAEKKCSYGEALELSVEQIFGDKAREMMNKEGT